MTAPAIDTYQQRYLAHQAKKRQQLVQIFSERTSQRIFNNLPIADQTLEEILAHAALAPSSCNRQGVYAQVHRSREQKEILSGILVGGVGWVHRADAVILLFSAKNAYKAEGEIAFMPFLDAGVTLAYLLLTGETHGIGMAYVNPNIRKCYQGIFQQLYGDDIFCGAVACGHYDDVDKAPSTPKKPSLLVR